MRSHETKISIDASIEEVWATLTDPEQMQRWLAPHMELSKADVGGVMLVDWGTECNWRTVIEVWEPNRHLRMVDTRDDATLAPSTALDARRLIQDFYLTSEKGVTTLRF